MIAFNLSNNLLSNTDSVEEFIDITLDFFIHSLRPIGLNGRFESLYRILLHFVLLRFQNGLLQLNEDPQKAHEVGSEERL